MEFLIEWLVVTVGITLIVVAVSTILLRLSHLHQNKPASIILPAILAFGLGAAGLDDYTSVGQWAYFVLPPLILAPLLVYVTRPRVSGEELTGR